MTRKVMIKNFLAKRLVLIRSSCWKYDHRAAGQKTILAANLRIIHVREFLWRLKFHVECLSQAVNTHVQRGMLFLSRLLMFRPTLSPGQALSTR